MAERLDHAYWANYKLNKAHRSLNERELSEKKSSFQERVRRRKEDSSLQSFSSPKFPSSSRSNSQSQNTFPANSSKFSGPNKKKDPEYKKDLGPDGKLLPKEREHRIKNNLCLLCGQADHMINECPRRRKPEASTPVPTLARATITVSPLASEKFAGETLRK